jgi:hypothetical protein
MTELGRLFGELFLYCFSGWCGLLEILNLPELVLSLSIISSAVLANNSLFLPC